MKNVVITGSTRGIGYGLAEEFLKRGHRVVITGSSPESTETALEKFKGKYKSDSVTGIPCNVSNLEEMQNLWDGTTKTFGSVDIWINNAGIGQSRHNFWEIPSEQYYGTVKTNILGTMYGSRVALQGMLKQGRGQIYNMEGQGSDGTMRPGLTLYGTTKAAITALTKGLIKEVKGKPVQVCYLSPGMVITDLLVGDYSPEEFERVKRIFNILADKLETVSPWLVDQILANDKHGARIAWLTPQKAAYRFLTARFNKRDLFS